MAGGGGTTLIIDKYQVHFSKTSNSSRILNGSAVLLAIIHMRPRSLIQYTLRLFSHGRGGGTHIYFGCVC